MLQAKTRKRHNVAPVDYKLGITIYILFLVKMTLVFLVSNDLNWKMHIDQIICKANRILCLIRHTMDIREYVHGHTYNDVEDSLTRKILYLAHVRPILEYGSEIWNLSTKSLINAFERVQRRARATRFIVQILPPMESVCKNATLLVLRTCVSFKDNILLF